MSSIFDIVKLYASEWTEVNSRKFTPEECKAVQGASVVASQFGKSVCFLFVNGKRYIPLEPTSDVAIGTTLAVDKLEIVALKYTGTNSQQRVKDILRIRIKEEESPTCTFENPFGL